MLNLELFDVSMADYIFYGTAQYVPFIIAAVATLAAFAYITLKLQGANRGDAIFASVVITVFATLVFGIVQIDRTLDYLIEDHADLGQYSAEATVESIIDTDEKIIATVKNQDPQPPYVQKVILDANGEKVTLTTKEILNIEADDTIQLSKPVERINANSLMQIDIAPASNELFNGGFKPITMTLPNGTAATIQPTNEIVLDDNKE